MGATPAPARLIELALVRLPIGLRRWVVCPARNTQWTYCRAQPLLAGETVYLSGGDDRRSHVVTPAETLRVAPEQLARRRVTQDADVVDDGESRLLRRGQRIDQLVGLEEV